MMDSDREVRPGEPGYRNLIRICLQATGEPFRYLTSGAENSATETALLRVVVSQSDEVYELCPAKG